MLATLLVKVIDRRPAKPNLEIPLPVIQPSGRTLVVLEVPLTILRLKKTLLVPWLDPLVSPVPTVVMLVAVTRPIVLMWNLQMLRLSRRPTQLVSPLRMHLRSALRLRRSARW